MAIIDVERRDETPVLVEVRDSLGGAARRVLAALRVGMGFIFVWAFLDKLFALGFSTGRLEGGGIDFFAQGGAWLNGGSPTRGFLSGSRGPLASFWQGLAGDAWVNWLFMGALAAVGVALLLGIGLRLAAVGGSLLLLSMWSVAMLPGSNPFVDSHIIYALVLVVLALTAAGNTWGLGARWGRTGLVQRVPFLK
jgi:thiosulfate dehydrogenase [quinone] large subunit